MTIKPLKDNINVSKIKKINYNAIVTFQIKFVELNKKIILNLS